VARIRTVKPEAFTSESLACVTVEAERTFFGLLTQADDEGRHRDNPAIIAGVLWPLRAEHTSVHVEDDLAQLAAAGLVCRYTGCDGKRYLHIVGWAEHQKIDKRSQSRMPVCTEHHADHRCGRCGGPCRSLAEPSATAPQPLAEGSARAPGALPEPSAKAQRALASPSSPAPAVSATGVGTAGAGADTTSGPEEAAGPAIGEFAGHTASAEPSANPPRALAEGSAPGSGILDRGSSVPTGHQAPGAPDPVGASAVSTKDLIGEYVASCVERPPGDVIGHLGRVVKKLLAEGIEVQHVRAGLRRYAEIQGHPSRLPSLVNDEMNAPGGPGAGLARPGSRSTVPAHRAWTNPADPAAAYAEEL
jgi:hypothetical protein